MMEDGCLLLILGLAVIFVVSAVLTFSAIDLLRSGKRGVNVTNEVASDVSGLGLREAANVVKTWDVVDRRGRVGYG